MKKIAIKGGYAFPAKKTDFPLRTIISPLPQEVTVPVLPTHNTAPEILVKPGDIVQAGDIIARDDDHISSCILASISGTVSEITAIDYLGRETEAVKIISDKKEAVKDIRHIAKEKPEVLYLAGVTAAGRSNIPSKFNTSKIIAKHIRQIIINTVDAEPFSVMNEALLRDNTDAFFKGCDILHQLFGQVIEVKVVVDAAVINALSLDKYLQERDWIELFCVKNKYPVHTDDILARIVLGAKLTPSQTPESLGYLIFDAADIFAVNDAVNEGRPYIEHTFELNGPALDKPVLIKGRIGENIGDLISQAVSFTGKDIRFALNSIMTGVELKDLSFSLTPFVKRIFCVEENRKREFLWFLSPGLRRDTYSRAYLGAFLPMVSKKFDTNIHGEARPCIACGWCEEVCPVDGLLPHLLSKYAKAGLFEEAVRFKPEKCIECGLCTYVCPAKIELMDDMKRCKQGILELE